MDYKFLLKCNVNPIQKEKKNMEASTLTFLVN